MTENLENAPPPELMRTLDRIATLMAILCEPLGTDIDVLIRNLDPECTAFLVVTPWGEFSVHDNGHDDHWSGGEMKHDRIRKIPGCHQLHDILRLQLLMVLDKLLIEMTKHMDGAPPPERMN